MHKRCSGIKGKLKEDRKFKCQTYKNYQTDIAESCSISRNCEKFCYLGDTVRAREGAVDYVITNKDQELME